MSINTVRLSFAKQWWSRVFGIYVFTPQWPSTAAPPILEVRLQLQSRCALHRTRLIIHIPLWLGLVVAIPFDLVIAVTGRNLPISSSRIQKLATATAFNADKVQAAGFQARVSLMDGIARMVEWYGTAKDDAMTGSDSGG
ncbi:MAG: hypothetical protein NTY87_08175 [Planctomycetia bacterium]|nr:hypothetical protein [Planctomycetia bacterium]